MRARPKLSPPPLALVRGRITLMAAFCAAAFGLVGARLVDVMVFGGGTATATAVESRAPVMRADLVDRNGMLIARDLPVHDLYASPAVFSDTGEAARELAQMTGADAAHLAQAFAARHGYILVKRALTPDEQDAVMHLGLPGLTFERSYKRYYPGGRIVAHAIGQVDIDDNGVSGLELGLDRRLRADGGTKPVQLSLDIRIQYALAHEIHETASAFHAKAAGGIVLNVRTGEVLALASFPDFEPNRRWLAPGESPRNRMTYDRYELGSIFKIFSFAEALEEQAIRLDESFNVGRPFEIAHYAIHDSHPLGPVLTAAEVFAQSSNIGTAQIAMRFAPDHQQAFLARMGLLDAVQSELPETRAPMFPAHWQDLEAATISFGHGISVSPLAFAAAAAAVVNGGTRIVPTFLKRDQPQAGERVLSAETSATMRQLLRLVVTSGTGTKANVPGYDVGGKTGTAEKPNGHGYARHALISSFCGVFPIEDPQYLVFVMLDEPQGTADTAGFATAGYTSAPLAGNIIARIAPLLGLPRNTVSAAADGL